jgi:hypothetical protein
MEFKNIYWCCLCRNWYIRATYSLFSRNLNNIFLLSIFTVIQLHITACTVLHENKGDITFLIQS